MAVHDPVGTADGDGNVNPAGSRRPGSLAGTLLASVRKPRPPWSVEAIALLIVVIAVGWAAWRTLFEVLPLLWTAVFAALVYLSLAPAVDRLAARRWPRSWAALLMLLALASFVVVLLVVLTPLAVAEIERAIKAAPTIVAKAGTISSAVGLNLDQMSNTASLQGLLAQLREALPGAAGGSVSVTSSVLGILLQGLVALILAFLLLVEQDRVGGGLVSLFQPRTRVIVGAAWTEAVAKTECYLYARILTSFLAGTFIGVALAVLGCPYPVALAVWYGLVSQFVPTIGTYVAATPPLLLLMGLHNPWDALWFLIVLVVWIPLHDHLIMPRLSAATMPLSPAAVLVALAMGVAVFGTLGAFLALPAAALIQSVVSASLTPHEIVIPTAHVPGR